MNEVLELNRLWHIIGMKMKNEMYSGKYELLVGISILELSILEAIEKNPFSMMKNISDVLCLPKSTLTSAVNRLEDKGYIIRTKSQFDKRAYNLQLTKLGAKAQKEHCDIENYVFKEMMDKLNLNERKKLIELFLKAVE